MVNKLEIHDMFDNTAHIQRISEYINLEHGTPYRNKSASFCIGQSVTSNGKGAMKAGVTFKIEDVNTINGFSRYYGAGMWHLESDIYC